MKSTEEKSVDQLPEVKSVDQLSYPFYMYPGGCPIFYGYHNTSLYIVELYRLKKLFLELKELKKEIILHITIGAAMEEFKDRTIIGMQYQQLFPVHLLDAIDAKKKIVHIIISPNISFEPEDNFILPMFVHGTNDIEWKINSDRSFIDTTDCCKTYLFCTPMPSNDPLNGSKLDKYRQLFADNIEYNINLYQQTDIDIKFVKQFYILLDDLFGSVEANGGVITCFSFAVFNETTNRAKFDNYYMFKEIQKLFSDMRMSTRLLAEWRFNSKNYTVIRYKTHESISYDLYNKHNKYIVLEDGKIVIKSLTKTLVKLGS